VGVLAVDFISPAMNEAVWSALADKLVNQKDADKVIHKACRKLVQAFGKDAKRQGAEAEEQVAGSGCAQQVFARCMRSLIPLDSKGRERRQFCYSSHLIY
jgi:hypothetical protein